MREWINLFEFQDNFFFNGWDGDGDGYHFRVSNIEWDDDGEGNLPDSVIIYVEKEYVADIEENAADILSDEYGYCVLSFEFSRI